MFAWSTYACAHMYIILPLTSLDCIHENEWMKDKRKDLDGWCFTYHIMVKQCWFTHIATQLVQVKKHHRVMINVFQIGQTITDHRSLTNHSLNRRKMIVWWRFSSSFSVDQSFNYLIIINRVRHLLCICRKK